MLVLTRKVGEQIRIGPDIVVTVLDVRNGNVRLGIQAPKKVPVVRAELLLEDDGPPGREQRRGIAG